MHYRVAILRVVRSESGNPGHNSLSRSNDPLRSAVIPVSIHFRRIGQQMLLRQIDGTHREWLCNRKWH